MFLSFLMRCNSEFNANWVLKSRLVNEHSLNWPGLIKDNFVEEGHSLNSRKVSYPACLDRPRSNTEVCLLWASRVIISQAGFHEGCFFPFPSEEQAELAFLREISSQGAYF